MAAFRKVHTIFWSDPFIKSLSPEQKYFFLYLLTNERTKQCGIYEITLQQMAFDTGYNIDTVCTLCKYYINKAKIAYSFETQEIAIKNWHKYNGSESPTVQKLVNQEIEHIKDKKLIEWLHSIDTVWSQYPQREREEEGEKEGERDAANLISDIEEYLTKNKNQWDVICSTNRHLGNGQIRKILKKYHLWNIENARYPKLPVQLIAGFSKWLINEKTNNLETEQEKSHSAPLRLPNGI